MSGAAANNKVKNSRLARDDTTGARKSVIPGNYSGIRRRDTNPP